MKKKVVNTISESCDSVMGQWLEMTEDRLYFYLENAFQRQSQ